MAQSPWGLRISASTALLSMVSFAVAISTPPRSGPFCRSNCLVAPYRDAGRFVPRDYLWMYPTIVLVLATFVLFGFLYEQRVREPRRWLSGIGRSFAGVAVTVLLLAYGLQLLVLQPALLHGSNETLSVWTQYDPSGLFIALESIGYATMGLAFVFVGAALVRDGSELMRAGGRTLVAGGTLILVLLVVLAGVYRSDLSYRFEVWSLLITWLVLAVTGVLLSLAFRRVDLPQRRERT
jgi:hypothetical protein